MGGKKGRKAPGEIINFASELLETHHTLILTEL